MSECGVYYIVTGSLHEEARESVHRLRDVSNYPIAVATDRPAQVRDWADSVVPIEDPKEGFADKAENMHRSPFRKTVYLDTDTWVVDGGVIDELFELLGRVDLGAALDTARRPPYLTENVDPDSLRAPPAFSLMNTGVLVFERDPLRSTFEHWSEKNRALAERNEGINDQVAFREAVYQSDVEYGILPTEYNFRVPYSQYYSSPVRIIHGRCSDPSELARQLNSSLDRDAWRVGRMYHPVWNTLAPLEGEEIDIDIREMNSAGRLRVLRHLFRTLPIRSIVLYTIIGGGEPRRGHARWKKLPRRKAEISDAVDEHGLYATVSSLFEWIRGGEFRPGGE